MLTHDQSGKNYNPSYFQRFQQLWESCIETPRQKATINCSYGRLFYIHLSTWLFPVSYLRCWENHSVLPVKQSLCHQTTLLVSHWPNSTRPPGPALELLQLTRPLPLHQQQLCVCCSNFSQVFVFISRPRALPLCCQLQWSAPRTWWFSECFFCAMGTQRGQVNTQSAPEMLSFCTFRPVIINYSLIHRKNMGFAFIFWVEIFIW